MPGIMETEAETAVRDFEAAVAELTLELERLSRNVQDVGQYQAQMFQVTTVLCSWMENIEGLAVHRAQPHDDSSH